MHTTSKWLDHDEHILYEDLSGDWSLQDYINLFELRAQMLAPKNHLVDIIADLTHNHTSHTVALAASRYANTCKPINQNKVVFLNPNANAPSLVKTLKKLNFVSAENLYLAYSMEEALDLIGVASV